VDESSINDAEIKQRHGHSQHGESIPAPHDFRLGDRVSFIPILSIDGIQHVEVLPDADTAEDYYDSLRTFVTAGIIQPYPGPRSVVVMDNARIAGNLPTRTLIEEECGKQA